MFGSCKILRKEKNSKKNDFLMFGFPIKKILKKSNIIKIS